MSANRNLVLSERADVSGTDPGRVTDACDLPFVVDDGKSTAHAADTAAGRHGFREVASRSMKVAISVLWYSGASASRALTRLSGRRPKARLVVLYYHGVPDEARARFAGQMQALSRKTTVVRAAHVGELPNGGDCVAITFDDAFRSVGTNAVPELVRRGFPATIFVPVDCLGKKPSWEVETHVDDQVMTCDELRSLPEIIEFGSHGLSHPHLARIDMSRVVDEVATSRHKLEELLGKQISLFAFPYGDYDERVVETCRSAGYERVFAIDPRPADLRGRDFVRGRVPVEPTDGRLFFHLKASGAYAWMTHASALKRRLTSRRRSS
jgi:peptidoglycan/xylan/chitin deacetylase (PgdA/CDA1 family)